MTEKECSKGHHRRHNTHDEGFDHSLPRPPVPGEEQDPRSGHHDWACTEQRLRAFSPLSPYRQNYGDSCATMGYDIEPSYKAGLAPAGKHDRPQELSQAGCLRWAKSLHKLLDDPDGVAEFRRYLEAEGGHHADALDFWFACKGLRMVREPDRRSQLIKVIYRKYFGKCLLPIPDELRREVGRRVKSSGASELGAELFDEAQFHIENLINNTTYPNFLKSETYLQLVQLVQNPNGGSSSEFSSESSSSSSSVSLREMTSLSAGPDPLPIIYEDSEFRSVSSAPLGLTPGTGCLSTGYQTPNFSGPVRLTKDVLLVTQKHRAMDVRPKPEAYVDSFIYRGMAPQHYNSYNSYNPVSRQDSERQSLSSHSDARTESDNMSMTDSSVSDGRSMCRTSRRKAQAEARQARESAALNKETHLHQAVIPRTQRIDTRQYTQNPDEFAAILIEKLKCVKKEQDTQELLDRKLKESESTSSLHLANAICAKLQLEDDNDQDILDQHVLRVFKDLTPTIKSPRSHSPTRNRWAPGYRSRRKEKDGFSTFSSDSGNVHDFADNPADHKMVKSKSTPEYADERFARGSAGRRSSSKKTLTDLTDSGVSVVSDTPPSCPKDTRVLAWLMESDRGGRAAAASAAYTHSEMSSGRHGRGHRPGSATSPNAARQHRKGSSSKYLPDVSQSTQSTLRKSMRGPRPVTSHAPNPEDVTVVVYSFYDEKVPYRTKIPGRHITLRQFKDFLPKKGNYRYFFKTECEELDNQVIQEEISADGEVLPTFDGKIMAQIKPLD